MTVQNTIQKSVGSPQGTTLESLTETKKKVIDFLKQKS
jgi:hypothetical protein